MVINRLVPLVALLTFNQVHTNEDPQATIWVDQLDEAASVVAYGAGIWRSTPALTLQNSALLSEHLQPHLSTQDFSGPHKCSVPTELLNGHRQSESA